jgi:FlaA1/EpsC-like NDP-sugar epimerase
MLKIKDLLREKFLSSFKLRKSIRIGLESSIWILSSIIASFIVYDGIIPNDRYIDVVNLGFLGSFVYFLSNILFAVYKTQLIKASFEETIKIGLSIVTTTTIVFVIVILFEFPNLPKLTAILFGLVSLVMQLNLRILISGRLNKRLFSQTAGIKILIYGSGISGQQIVDQMLHETASYDPIGFLDDNYNKRNFMYKGRRVLGSIDSLEEVVKNRRPKILVVAISNISASSLIKLEQRCQVLKIPIRIIPNALEFITSNLKLSDILELSIEEILGRHQISFEMKDLVQFFSDKRILITGAGGSIGSEIAKQISSINISNLFLLDRDENSLLHLCLSINGDGLFNNNNLVLCDIRDSVFVSKVIRDLKPDVVFHAAALKHLVLLEKFPDEAYKTNVVATKNLIDCCLENNVKYFINISTDKAADPISQLGKSKYICERIISGINKIDKNYISVRFGNVVGSNGSFLNTFRQQISNGGPVTVTHCEVSRYFMTIEEAVYLVLKSILVGKCGETLILNMGEPIKINEVAKKMIADSGKNIEIKYTGLRPGEKMNEILIGKNETTYHGENMNIFHTKVPPYIDEIL